MKKNSLWICVLTVLFAAATATAQPVGGMTAAKRLQVAEDKLKQGDLYNALDWFEKAFEDDQNNLNVIGKIAQLNYRLRDYRKAEQWYNRLVTADTKAVVADGRFYFARCLKINGKYDKAAAEFLKFIAEYKGTDASLKKLAANEIVGAEMASELKDDPNVRIENAGLRINSPFSEFSPLPVGNDELYYGSIRSDSVIVIDDKKNDFYALIYAAKREEKGFSEGKPLSNTVNKTGFHTGNMTLTADKNTMYFTRCMLNNNVLGHCDVFATQRANGGDWAEATKLSGINNDGSTAKQPAFGQMNGNNGLFFVSDRPGGQGGWDLYFAQQLPDGTFATPLNLGDKVNTVGNEETPFFHNGTLYFASDGQPTIGGYDIFSSRAVGNEFETPKNLGKGVNSRVDDMYFTIADNDYQGFLVSNRPGTNSLKSETCCDDIWTVELPFYSNLLVTTTDRDSKLPLKAATVRLIEVGGKDKQSKNNPAGNDFAFAKLPTEKRYKLVATAAGYYSDSTEVTTAGLKKPADLTAVLKLIKIPPPPPIDTPPVLAKPEPPIALHNIYWDFDKAVVRTPDAVMTLDTITRALLAHKEWLVEVASHTDALGSNPYNDQLSDRRTKAAIEYLAKFGVTATQLVPAHFGEDAPVEPNNINGKDNPTGRQRNRRTEFHIIGKPTTTATPPIKTGQQSVELDAKKK